MPLKNWQEIAKTVVVAQTWLKRMAWRPNVFHEGTLIRYPHKGNDIFGTLTAKGEILDSSFLVRIPRASAAEWLRSRGITKQSNYLWVSNPVTGKWKSVRDFDIERSLEWDIKYSVLQLRKSKNEVIVPITLWIVVLHIGQKMQHLYLN